MRSQYFDSQHVKKQTYKVVHESGAHSKRCGTCGELDLVNFRAVLCCFSSVVNRPGLVVDQLRGLEPLPGL